LDPFVFSYPPEPGAISQRENLLVGVNAIGPAGAGGGIFPGDHLDGQLLNQALEGILNRFVVEVCQAGELAITSSDFARTAFSLAPVIPQGEVEKLLGGRVPMLDYCGSEDTSFG